MPTAIEASKVKRATSKPLAGTDQMDNNSSIRHEVSQWEGEDRGTRQDSEVVMANMPYLPKPMQQC